jgi:hypothetical protein
MTLCKSCYRKYEARLNGTIYYPLPQWIFFIICVVINPSVAATVEPSPLMHPGRTPPTSRPSTACTIESRLDHLLLWQNHFYCHCDTHCLCFWTLKIAYPQQDSRLSIYRKSCGILVISSGVWHSIFYH